MFEKIMNQKIADMPRKLLSAQECETQNKIGSPKPHKMPAIKMKGRRRPNLVRTLSDIQPIHGSENAS